MVSEVKSVILKILSKGHFSSFHLPFSFSFSLQPFNAFAILSFFVDFLWFNASSVCCYQFDENRSEECEIKDGNLFQQLSEFFEKGNACLLWSHIQIFPIVPKKFSKKEREGSKADIKDNGKTRFTVVGHLR